MAISDQVLTFLYFSVSSTLFIHFADSIIKRFFFPDTHAILVVKLCNQHVNIFCKHSDVKKVISNFGLKKKKRSSE